MVRRISSSIFVGRVMERATLESSLDAAGQGEPGLVLLGGEAGIGKTRLTKELAAQAAARGVRFALGRCVEVGAASTPFAPWVEVLRDLLVDGRGGTLAPRLAPELALLARLVPSIDLSVESRDNPPTGHERLRLFRAMVEFLGGVARDQPLLVVLEDVHWADPSSLDLLRYIAAELNGERLLIVATLRSDELHRRHPLVPILAELVRMPHVMRLDLPSFTEAEVADQLTGIGGSRPAKTVAKRVFARSDGNPFFVEELSGHTADAPVPVTLHDVLVARLATLSPESRGVVLATAAIGREATHELIAKVTALPPEPLAAALRDALEHHVLVQVETGHPAGFAFRHALIQEVAYAELMPAERIAMHGSIVASLLEAGDSPGEIARHALLGHDLPVSLSYSVRAADQAIESLAFAEGLAHLDRTIELWAGVSEPESLARRDLASLLTLAARCADALGLWSRAAEYGRLAIARLDPVQHRDERLAVLIRLSRWSMLADDEAGRAAAVLEAGDLIASEAPSALRASVTAELAHLANHGGRLSEARRLAEEAIEMAHAVGARAEEAHGLVRLSDALASSMQVQVAQRRLEEALRIAAEGHPPFDDFDGYAAFRQAAHAYEMGAFTRAIEIADAGTVRAAHAGRFGQRSGFLRLIKLSALSALGRWDEAEHLAREAMESGGWMALAALEGLVGILIRRGRVVDAATAAHAADVAYATPEQAVPTILIRIHVANAEGRWDDARAAADELIGLVDDPGSNAAILDMLVAAVAGEADRAEHARTRRRSGEETDARRVGAGRLELLYRARGTIAAGSSGPRIEAELATVEAEVSRLAGRHDATMWEAVARRRNALAQPWEAAYAGFRQAEAILGAGRGKREAPRLLVEAYRIAEQLGARPLVDQIEGLAQRSRIRLVSAPPARRSHKATTSEGVVVALTTREWEVLSLVAAGHTNREIGEALFISAKTASVHVTNAMDKLGALSRYDAAAAATRLGLLTASAGERVAP